MRSNEEKLPPDPPPHEGLASEAWQTATGVPDGKRTTLTVANAEGTNRLNKISKSAI